MSNKIDGTIGFIGLGAMGEPMALNLAKSGLQLVVWNRTPAKCTSLKEAGADIAVTPSDVFARCSTIFLMLTDDHAIDSVLSRGAPEMVTHVSGRNIINAATVSPDYSKALEADIRRSGGRYVEAPVSGSRKPAEAGQLVAMIAGDPEAVEQVRHLFSPICRAVVPCGEVPRALSMKFASNIFLIATITGLAEAAHFAKVQGLDLKTWGSIVNASQMASDISRLKVDKLLAGDFSAQAAIGNVTETARLIVKSAEDAGISAPIMNACLPLYRRAQSIGLDLADMIAVTQAFEDRLE